MVSRSEGGFEPKVVAFLCNWCAYAGADLAGTQRLTYPANVRIVRVMCSGRVDPGLVLQAFLGGADGVLVAGCHPGDCHYESGNRIMQRRLTVAHHLLQSVGVEPDRLRLAWVSANEGRKFAAVIDEVVRDVRALGPFTALRRPRPASEPTDELMELGATPRGAAGGTP